MKKRTIIVTGLAATYPLGGVSWDYLQYLLGFIELGHEAYYLEDTGCWPFDPDQMTFVEDGTKNAGYLAEFLRRLKPGLEKRFCYRDVNDVHHGLSREELAAVLRKAELFVNISAASILREEYLAVPVKALIDSDPLYTQSGIPAYLDGTAGPEVVKAIENFKRHDVFFSFGENVGQPGCLVPDAIFDWKPTRQPVVLSCWQPAPPPRREVFTTVLSWRPKEDGPLVGGVRYGGKNLEFERLIDLPGRTDAVLELALSGTEEQMAALREHGWRVVPGTTKSRTPWDYRDYLAEGLGEFSTAKNAYVASRSGWFSCRSACYLASGRPVVVQDTGFSDFLPVGEGVLAYTDAEGALAGIEAVRADWGRQSAAALKFAREHFNAREVLARLLEEALA